GGDSRPSVTLPPFEEAGMKRLGLFSIDDADACGHEGSTAGGGAQEIGSELNGLRVEERLQKVGGIEGGGPDAPHANAGSQEGGRRPMRIEGQDCTEIDVGEPLRIATDLAR